MDNGSRELDKWAAEFNGEQTEEEVADAVESQFYTGSPAAAFAVLVKVAAAGTPVSVKIDGSLATVDVGDEGITGKSANLGRIIIEACKEHANGKHS